MTPTHQTNVDHNVTQTIGAGMQVGNEARIVENVIGGTAFRPIENLTIEHVGTQRIFIQINEPPSLWRSFLQGMATASGGIVAAITIYKTTEIVAGVWRGATAGNAIGGPAGALAGGLIGGSVALLV